MKRVLIVEDDRDLAQTLAEVLGTRYEVDVASDGEQAIARLQAADYDAVLLDLMLPVLPGEAVLEEMGRRGIRVPVIISTARDDGAEVMKRGGATDWIRKPYPMPALFDALARVLGDEVPAQPRSGM